MKLLFLSDFLPLRPAFYWEAPVLPEGVCPETDPVPARWPGMPTAIWLLWRPPVKLRLFGYYAPKSWDAINFLSIFTLLVLFLFKTFLFYLPNYLIAPEGGILAFLIYWTVAIVFKAFSAVLSTCILFIIEASYPKPLAFYGLIIRVFLGLYPC